MALMGERKGHLLLAVKARPGARVNKVVGVVNDELIVDVAAPPEDGKATRELLHFLAKTLGVSKAEVQLFSGPTARHKLIALPLAARATLEKLLLI